MAEDLTKGYTRPQPEGSHPVQYWVGLDSTGAHVIASAAKPTGYSEVLGPYTKAVADQVAGTLNTKAKTPTGPTGLNNPLKGIDEVGHWLGDAWLHISDLAMWRSIGWLILGLIFLWIGIITLLKLPQKAAKAGASAAPLLLAA